MASFGPYSSADPPSGGSARGRHRAPDPDEAPDAAPPEPSHPPEPSWPLEAPDPDADDHPTGAFPVQRPATSAERMAPRPRPYRDGPDMPSGPERYPSDPGVPDFGRPHQGFDRPRPGFPAPGPEDPGADVPGPGFPEPGTRGAVVPGQAGPYPPGGYPDPAGRDPRPGDPSAGGDPWAAGGQPAPERSGGRAGRNLPAAIGVGVGLGAVVLASLFLYRPAFMLVLLAAVVIGTWETTRALGRATDPARRARPPLVPLLVGAVVTEGVAWFRGLPALTVGLLFTVVALLIWRLADSAIGYRRDVIAGALVAAYVAFLAGFGVLLARPDDGASRVVMVLAMVVCSDTGGYAVGVFLGRHRMAPGVSPGKSWEGFGGSVLACAVAGAIMINLIFHQPWWYGVVFGVAVSLVSVLGDLAESLLKRDLGIKDMGHLLPGHGGVMDRLDSILFALPVSFALLTVLAPPAG